MIGVIFMWIYLVVNIVTILNLVIAILSRVYSEYSRYSRGIFYDTIVQMIAKYKYDKQYGALVRSYGPLNIVSLALCPVYFLLSICSKKVLSKFNQAVLLVYYLPFAICVTVSFVIWNILLLPVAYLS